MSVVDYIASIIKGRTKGKEKARDREEEPGILSLVKEGEDDKAVHMARWDYYLKFLRGRQNLRSVAGGYEEIEAKMSQDGGDDDDVVPVINLIKPNSMSVLSSLLTNFPGARVVPASDSSVSS